MPSADLSPNRHVINRRSPNPERIRQTTRIERRKQCFCFLKAVSPLAAHAVPDENMYRRGNVYPQLSDLQEQDRLLLLKRFYPSVFLSDSKTVRLPPLKNSISDDMNAFCTPWKEIPCERALSNSHIRLSKRLCNRVLFRRFQREFFPCHLPKKMEKLLFTLHPGGISSILKEREFPGRARFLSFRVKLQPFERR